MAQKRNHNAPIIIDAASANPLLEALGTTLEPDLLIHALTHRSFTHENPGMPNNERLEFLGDAVLELVATETLFSQHPHLSEGQLAKMRAQAVSEDALSEIARTKLQLGQYILLGIGETDNGGADKNSILCDTVEALIGATFVAHGINGARPVVHRLIDDTLERVANAGPALDWKTSLNVMAHKLNLPEPMYRMSVKGPEYRLEFTAHVSMGESDEVIGVGVGPSKRKAQLQAASKAYRHLEKQYQNILQAENMHEDESAGTQ